MFKCRLLLISLLTVCYLTPAFSASTASTSSTSPASLPILSVPDFIKNVNSRYNSNQSQLDAAVAKLTGTEPPAATPSLPPPAAENNTETETPPPLVIQPPAHNNTPRSQSTNTGFNPYSNE